MKELHQAGVRAVDRHNESFDIDPCGCKCQGNDLSTSTDHACVFVDLAALIANHGGTVPHVQE